MKQTMSMKDLYEQLNQLSSTDVVLDVRTVEEYRMGHVPGSINIPHEQVSARHEELKSYQRIIVHCQAGRRSQIATQSLVQLGFTNLICIADSGMADWIKAGFPIEK